MAYSFVSDQYFIIPSASDDPTYLGAIQADENFELSDIVFRVQKVGTHTTETVKVELHSSETLDHAIYESDTYTYDDFGMSASHWAGQIRFSFDRVPLSKEITYYIKARTANYTYAEDQFLGFELDFPEEINNNETDSRLSAAMGIYGYFD